MDHFSILIVEDSRFFATMVRRRIEIDLDFNVIWMDTYARAEECVKSGEFQFSLALLDLHLPDAPNGEIVEFITSQNIPAIIFTSGFDGKMRDKMLAKNVVDYILKDNNASVDTLIATVRRFHRNQDIKILVADDSKPVRDTVRRLLHIHRYQTLEAQDGAQALELLKQNPDVRMVVTDYDMPKMDGFELVRRIRDKYPKNVLAVMGMSAHGDPLISAKFLKNGANDFVAKPFQTEEFYCRVDNNIDILEQISLIRNLSNIDPLTMLFNRRYLFEKAEDFMKRAKETGKDVCVTMVDIDLFKRVNDTFGHQAGDKVIKRVAGLLQKVFGEENIVARFGGEEFCVLSAHPADADFPGLLEKLRAGVEDSTISFDGDNIDVTISIGACLEVGDLEEAIKVADQRLYQAKSTGRNKVVLEDLELEPEETCPCP